MASYTPLPANLHVLYKNFNDSLPFLQTTHSPRKLRMALSKGCKNFYCAMIYLKYNIDNCTALSAAYLYRTLYKMTWEHTISLQHGNRCKHTCKISNKFSKGSPVYMASANFNCCHKYKHLMV